MKGFFWGNLTLLVVFAVALNYPVVRVEVAKILNNSSEFLFETVDRDKFDARIKTSFKLDY